MKLKRKKVYLSVSYNTSATVIQQVKKLIEAQGAEVLMYIKGSTYSVDKMLNSDILFGIPPEDIIQEELRIEDTQYNISVGRGQYDEAEFACEHSIPYYMLTRGLNQFSKFHSMFTNMPDNWKKDYGNIIIRGKYHLEPLLADKKNKRLLLLLN
jgi:hypothetical protein